jgi:hypothetical protein
MSPEASIISCDQSVEELRRELAEAHQREEAAGAATVLSFTILTEHFPKEMTLARPDMPLSIRSMSE